MRLRFRYFESEISYGIKIKHMKSSIFISVLGLFTLSLVLITSCQKQDEFDTNNDCPTCPSPAMPSYRSVNIDVNNWIPVANGDYRADFSDALKKVAGDFSSIAKVYLVNSTGDIEIGYSTPFQGGTLSRNGTLLIYHGQISFNRLEIRVYVY